jgi:hypothetical protein
MRGSVLAGLAAATIGTNALASSGSYSGFLHEPPTAEQLGLMIAAARARMPAFEVVYSHQLGAAEQELTFWKCALGTQGARFEWLSAERASAPFDAEEAIEDRTGWAFDAATNEASRVAGETLQVSHDPARLLLENASGEYENQLGVATMHAAACGGVSLRDPLSKLSGFQARLRAEEVMVAGYSCVVLDLPALQEADLETARVTYYFAEELNYAVVGSELFVQERLTTRRTATDFFELAAGAPWIPLEATVELFEGGELVDVQSLAVARDAQGAPMIRSGDAVTFAFDRPAGTRVIDIDTGNTYIVGGDWNTHAQTMLAMHGISPMSQPTHGAWRLASVGIGAALALGLGFTVGMRRRAIVRGIELQ